MVRYWPRHSKYNVLFSYSGGSMAQDTHSKDYEGIDLTEHNDLHKDEYRLIGAYIISNWSDEE